MAFNPDINMVYPLTDADGLPETRHRFAQDDVYAVQAAIACGRPLLVRGEPGIGKSQLARAAAAIMRVPFLWHTMTAESECRDLHYAFDAVERLAQAQVLGRVGGGEGGQDWRVDLAPERFVTPGPLWWCLSWTDARAQCVRRAGGDPRRAEALEPPRPEGWTEGRGCVLLVDEIDKADGAVPNALLESLGNLSFPVPELSDRVTVGRNVPPLVVITTNEERELPQAFVRRCLVLQMAFKPELMLERGRDHFGGRVHEDVLHAAAERLLEGRTAAPAFGPVLPGMAEYLDLLRAVATAQGKDAQRRRLDQVRRFVVAKNPGQHRVAGSSAAGPASGDA